MSWQLLEHQDGQQARRHILCSTHGRDFAKVEAITSECTGTAANGKSKRTSTRAQLSARRQGHDLNRESTTITRTSTEGPFNTSTLDRLSLESAEARMPLAYSSRITGSRHENLMFPSQNMRQLAYCGLGTPRLPCGWRHCGKTGELEASFGYEVGDEIWRKVVA